MKKVLTFTALSVFITMCAPVKKIVSKEINHTYYNISFSPEQINKNAGVKTEVTIVPIDAKVLNQETFGASKRDGNYEKEFSASIEKIQIELKNMSKADKRFYKGRINAIEELNSLIEKGKIPADIGFSLKHRIWNGKEYGKDGTEISCLSEIDYYPDQFNPFKINDKFLSVFKITFENKGSEIEKFYLKDFQIVSGEEQLYPLSTEYFEKSLEKQSEKIKNIYRLNMPNEITLTPNQRITKYLAVPAINTTNPKLQVQVIKDKNVSNFDFILTDKNDNRIYKLEGYDIDTDKGQVISYCERFHAVKFSQGIHFATIGKRFYISEDKKNAHISVYNIYIERETSKIYFVKEENITLSKLKNNSIPVKLKED